MNSKYIELEFKRSKPPPKRLSVADSFDYILDNGIYIAESEKAILD